jgi:hypothetical protein
MTYETSVFINNITNSLIQNYHQFPLDLESQSPECSLEKLTCHAGYREPEWLTTQETVHQFINGITKLDCFTYRAVNQVGDKLVYWNALLQPFDDFKQDGTVIYQTDAPYPTSDMIIAWCKRQVS